MTDISEKLASIPPLSKGLHRKDDGAMCFLEAVAFVAGEPWSHRPRCVCRVISPFLQRWNDKLQDDERDALLRPLIPRLLNTRATPGIERRRSLMAADWLVRECTPAWLRLADLTTLADALASLPKITSMEQYPTLIPVLASVRFAATAIWNPAWRNTREIAMIIAGSSGIDSARGSLWEADWYVAHDAAWVAAMVAAGAATMDSLNFTKTHLQQSALRLVDRMISCSEETE